MAINHEHAGIIDTRHSPHAKLQSVDLRAVKWLPGFWGDRFTQCREVTLPRLLELAADPERGHALTNLQIAAGLASGEFAGTHWQDEWVYKWLEAASYTYAATTDESLNQTMDEIIAVIAKAQQPDGYLATQTTVRGWPRLGDIRHHELYVMGHLMSAACAHHRATGKSNFLDVAVKVADYLYQTFIGRNPELANFGFNPSYIMGLIEVYRTVGDRRYLDIANVFIDMRGSKPSPRMAVHPAGSDQTQSRVPLREEEHVVGHMVLGTYLYAGATDAYLETGDESLFQAVNRLWYDLVERKMYVNGGVCPIHYGVSIRRDMVWEAADAEYHLPNSTAYNETCSQIGNFMWNWRLLTINGEARHADVMERNLYNSILSGIGLDGKSWFYTNVLRWYGQEHKLLSQDAYQRFEPGRIHVCCPSNLVRTIAGLHNYVYSVSNRGLWVHLYGASQFDGQLTDNSPLSLTQHTDYPWDGRVEIVLNVVPSTPLAINLRIPEWADHATVSVNGSPIEVVTKPSSYATVERTWKVGDRLVVNLPMRVRLVEGHPHIEETRNQVAVMRGPLLYCLESPDLPEAVTVSEVHLPDNVELTPRHIPDLLGGVIVLEGEARCVPANDWSGRLYREKRPITPDRCAIRLIPYYAWCNRGVSEMTVWLPLIVG